MKSSEFRTQYFADRMIQDESLVRVLTFCNPGVEGSMDRITFYGVTPAGRIFKGACMQNAFWRNVQFSLGFLTVSVARCVRPG